MEDLSRAVEIFPKIWWVGVALPDDQFQCHSYLIDHGDQSVLLDPGGALTIAATLEKIESVLPFSKIRYFVCHHQDPDIVGGLPEVERRIERDDARLVTHWRAAVLLKHLGLKKLPLWNIDEHEWRLDLGGRTIEFVFTPYLHFPGAFATFDTTSKTLFSSDLFGGFLQEPTLHAPGAQVIEGIRAFHEHYMPSREILLHTVRRVEQLGAQRIAPQHGSILQGELMDRVLRELSDLDCGLHLLSRQDGDLRRLLELSNMLKSALQILHIETALKTVAPRLLELFQRSMAAASIEFVAEDGGELLYFSETNRYRGLKLENPPASIMSKLAQNRQIAESECCGQLEAHESPNGSPQLVIPLLRSNEELTLGVALLGVVDGRHPDREATEVLRSIRSPMAAALERELLLRRIRVQRDEFHKLAIHDPLTGLHTRRHMETVVDRMCALHDRSDSASFAALIVDADHFKSVNDNYGHAAGDGVLQGIARTLMDTIRSADLAVRFGGEEFVILANLPSELEAAILAERLRSRVAELTFAGEGGPEGVTISVGFAVRTKNETFEALLERADVALYEAKRSGRNRVCAASQRAG